MKKGWIVGGVLLAVVVIGGMWLAGLRNGLVTANENVTASWAQVENVMQRRADLIPNLVNTVKGYAKQEQAIFTAVAEARAKLGGAQTVGQKINANNQLDSALSRLLVVVERYPDLKSNQNFQALQDELAGTENRIAVERLRFNEAVKNYNVLVTRFPNNLAAGVFGYQRRDEYFESTEGAKTAPVVNFDNAPAPVATPAQ
jgi:LemA protein